MLIGEASGQPPEALMIGLPSRLLKNIAWYNTERNCVVKVIIKYTVQSHPIGNPLGFSMLALGETT